jgi:hypothetical protein
MRSFAQCLSIAACTLVLPAAALSQVSYERILAADDEPESWLTYNGNYSSQR